jgi:nucleotide-binding universal stress UspA family protein
VDEIVVGIDGSDESRLALRWALAVAQPASTPVRVVESWSYPRLSVVSGAGDLAPPEEMDRRAVEDLEAVVADECGHVPDHVWAEALRGSPAGALLQAVTPQSMLVLGSRGVGGFTGLLLGSVSRECAAHAPCPVVVVRGEEPVLEPGSLIVVGKDGSPGAATALEWAVGLGATKGAEVVTVHAWQPAASEVRPRLAERLKSSAQAAVEAWTEEVSDGLRAIEVEGDPRDRLVDVAQATKARLIVVGRGEPGGIGGRRMGGVAGALLEDSPSPVAVIPPPASDRD